MNNRSRLFRAVVWIVVAASLGIIIFAFCASSLGFDNNNSWGNVKINLLLIGIAGFLFPMSIMAAEALDHRYIRHQFPFQISKSKYPRSRDYDNFEDGLLTATDETTKSSKSPQQALLGRFALLILIILIELLYVWFVSVGYWDKWPTLTNYYALLSDSFTHGQTSLRITPSPLLGELENPYPTSEREGIPVIADASYYRGNYYLYWGPVPAIGVALWSLLSTTTIGDQYIVFVAVSSIFMFSVLILLYMKRNFFPNLPGWLLATGIVISATAHPMLWVLNGPSIHEAAIASGQAFLIAGLYFALPIFTKNRSQPWRLVLVGFLWVFALGSRLTLIGAVVIFVLATVISMFYPGSRERDWKAIIHKVTLLGLPIVLGLTALGIYNLVRFDNFFESGLRYQMSYNNLGKMIEEGFLFNGIYSLPNLFHYLVAPLRFRSTFPFIRPLWQELPAFRSILNPLEIPSVYRIEDITGILFAMPTILLSGYAVQAVIGSQQRLDRDFAEKLKSNHVEQTRNFRFLIKVILIAAFMAFVPSILFFWVANRYFLDALPLIAILAALGSWLLYASSLGFPFRKPLIVFLILGVVTIATISSILLAMTGAKTRFDDLNPVLWDSITAFFTW